MQIQVYVICWKSRGTNMISSTYSNHCTSRGAPVSCKFSFIDFLKANKSYSIGCWNLVNETSQHIDFLSLDYRRIRIDQRLAIAQHEWPIGALQQRNGRYSHFQWLDGLESHRLANILSNSTIADVHTLFDECLLTMEWLATYSFNDQLALDTTSC